jgi:putative transposase
MCRLLGVSRSAYYDYVPRKDNRRSDPYHEELLDAVRNIAKSSHYTYGSRRMKNALHELNCLAGRWKARSLMKEAGVQVKHRKKYKVTTNSNHKQPVFENKLNRQFDAANPDQAYVGDITYLWTQQGWLYLAIVIDLFSRKVVGWSMSSRMKALLVCDALQMAIWRRRPQNGLIVHSDRGSQYASKEHRRLLQTHGFIGSMSRKGNCLDNAVAESFFGSLKQKRVQWRNYQTRYEAQQDVLQYITMFYNSHRLHSYLGYKSPNQYEAETANMKKVA